MLLLAIGYDGVERGYTGEGWESNVLSDAASVGLLSGFKYNVLATVPRQWLAVMVANMLTDAYTYKSFTDPETLVTMGEKYFNLTTDSLIYRQVYGQ